MGRVVLLVLSLWSCVALCVGACTVNDIKVAQASGIDMEKMDGHWTVTHQFGVNTTYSSHTVDVVPTRQGLTLYVSLNESSAECVYRATEMISTTEPTRFKTADSAPGRTWLVAATDNINFALAYSCRGVVSGDQSCDQPQARVMRRGHDSTAALSWLQSVTDSLPCFEMAESVVLPDGAQECPFKPIWGLRGRDCRVSTFPVQANFDLSKYMGRWWEMAWLAPFFIPASDLFLDYRHHYVMNDDGNATSFVAGRKPLDMDNCFYANVSLLMTNTPGRMVFKESYGDVPYNVATVEYDKYAVVYGCTEIDSTTGECKVAKSWIWSRDVTLDRQRRLAANSMLQRLCLNPGAFLTTEQNDQCSDDDITGSASTLTASLFVTSVMTLLARMM